MDLDPRLVPGPDLYRFLISAVIPRPIAFVSTRATDGHTNLAPFSFFNAISSVPPLLSIAINERSGDPKDTLRNIQQTREFVVNIVSEPLLDAMVQTAGEWPRGTSEFGPSGLTEAPAERVKAPRVAESPLHLECVLHREIPLGNSVLIVGEVVWAHVDDSMLSDGRIDALKLAAVGRLGGEWYSLLRDVEKRPRPRVSRASGETA